MGDVKLRIADPETRKRVIEIAIVLVGGQIERGELDGDDEVAVKAATQRACVDALAAYRAAEAYLCG